jgi:3-oxoacyl-[acyl-carrier-protein] synthase II
VNPDPAVDLGIVVGKTALKHDVDVALSNSFGFGGHNSSILFSKVSLLSARSPTRL